MLKLKQRVGLLQPATAYNPSGQRTVGTLLAVSLEAEQLRKKQLQQRKKKLDKLDYRHLRRVAIAYGRG